MDPAGEVHERREAAAWASANARPAWSPWPGTTTPLTSGDRPAAVATQSSG